MRSLIADGLIDAVLSGRRVVVAAGVPERGMRTLGILCAFTIFAQPKSWASSSAEDPWDDAPRGGSKVSEDIQPAYRFVEGVSDSVYDFARLHVVKNVLPEKLSRGLKAAPKEDSAPLFYDKLAENESRFLARANASYPLTVVGAQPPGEDQIRGWRNWAAGEQANVLAGTVTDTLSRRYDLPLFGNSWDAYERTALRRGDAGFLAADAVLNGAVAYVAGVHARATLGRVRIGLDMRPGLAIQRAVRKDGEMRSLAGVEVGLKDLPVTLSSEWGMASGRVRSERVAVNYALRY